MAAATILDFQICEILLADGVWRDQKHNFNKFPQNRSFRRGDIAIFRISKMAAAAILDFWQLKILLVIVVGGRDASACQILSKSVNWLWRY